MAIGERESVDRQIDALIRYGTIAGLTDRELLEKFARDGDERAFAGLVERHGAMVERTCLAILRDEHEAQDAFQAAFLLLARRAGRLWVGGSLGPWLHAVAWRVAVDSRKARARRRKHERRAGGRTPARVSSEAGCDSGLAAALHEEIGWLPARYRAVVVLCDIEGRTHVEAARLLGCRVGTVKSRQARARTRLRRQLTRRGLAPSVGLIGGVIAEARAAVPHALSNSSAHAVAGFVARGKESTSAGAIARSEVIAKVKRFDTILGASAIQSAAVALLAVVGIATGVAMFMGRAPASAPPRDPPKPQVRAVAHLDAAGDPLPAGAIARLGRRRFSHGDAVTAVAFQPTGKLVASAGSGHVKLWDASSGRLLRELPAHANYWQTLAFSPDGSLLASGSDDWTIRVWDVAKGQPVQMILVYLYGGGGTILPFRIAFAPDGKTLVCGCINGLIIVWDVATGRELFRLEPPPGRGNAQNDPFAAMISALAVSPDGKILASASHRTGIQLWDLKERRPLQSIPNDSSWVQLLFAPDGKTLAWAGRTPQPGSSSGIQFWDLADNRLRGSLPSERQNYIAFSRDGRRLTATGADRAVRLWDLETGELLKTMTGHTAQTNSVDLSPDGSTVASSSNDGSVRLWDAATGKERFGDPMDHWDQAMSVAVTAEDRSILIASRDRMIRTIDMITGELRRSVPVQGDLLSAAALSPDGNKAAVAEGALVSVYDLSTGRQSWSNTEFQPRPDLPEINDTTTPELVFSGDSNRLVSLTLDSRNGNRQRATVRVWDSATGRLVSQIVRNGYVAAPPVLLDGGRTLVLVETGERTPDQGRSERTSCLGFYETETGRPLREQGSPDRYSSALAAAPDGSWLATAGNDWVQVWDTASGTLAYTLGGMRFAKSVERLAVSPDGTQIAAAERRVGGDHDGMVHVWRVADGRRIHELAADATALAFARDSRSLITCGGDGTALVWDLSSAATAPPARRQPTDREIDERWALLACGYLPHLGDDGGRAPRVDALAEGGDRTVEFLTPRLLDPKLAQKDEAEVASLFHPLTDRDPKVRVQAAARLEQYGVHAEAYLPERAKVSAQAAFLDTERQLLRECFRDRRDERVYSVLRQIGTLRARWLLRRLAEGLPDDVDNRDRKRNAAETAAALDRARLRMPGQPIEQVK